MRGSLDGHLVVARSGDEAFSSDEIDLLRGMARVMELTFDMLRTLEAERLLRDRSERQAAENAALLTSLRERQRLLEKLSEIQRSISRREPLTDILDAITGGLHDLLGDDIVVFRRSDGGERVRPPAGVDVRWYRGACSVAGPGADARPAGARP